MNGGVPAQAQNVPPLVYQSKEKCQWLKFRRNPRLLQQLLQLQLNPSQNRRLIKSADFLEASAISSG